MDTFAAQKLATRKFIEHIGQDFLRQNTMDVVSDVETQGELFKMTWTSTDPKLSQETEADEDRVAPRVVSVSVNLDNGDIAVIRDTGLE